MKIIRTKDYEEMSRKAANLISAQILLKPDCVLGLATGSTPIGIYDQLVEWYKKGDLDFSTVKTVNLDEYKGLTRDNEQSYYYFMHHHLFDRVNIDEENTHVPNGKVENGDEECLRYEALIKSMGGVDLQLLGLGRNGHIGFNEPSIRFSKGSFKVKLTQSTISANSKYFDENPMPTHALTMGVGSIMKAQKIVLIATGIDKADAIAAMISGDVTPVCPASILQFHHDVDVYIDKAAASLL